MLDPDGMSKSLSSVERKAGLAEGNAPDTLRGLVENGAGRGS